MNSIGIIILGWIIFAAALGVVAFRMTPPPLNASSEVSLVGSVTVRSAFWAYLFAPYAVFVVIAPASLFIPAYLADPDPGWQRHLRECLYSLFFTWLFFVIIYAVRQIIKKRQK